MKRKDKNAQLRQFGLIVGGLFALVGIWPAVIRAGHARLWALALTVALVVPALVMPRLLTHVHRVWMALGETLGWINTRILLSLLFYAVVTPMGIVLRWLGRDPMQRSFDPRLDTYRVPKAARPGTHMIRQF